MKLTVIRKNAVFEKGQIPKLHTFIINTIFKKNEKHMQISYIHGPRQDKDKQPLRKMKESLQI